MLPNISHVIPLVHDRRYVTVRLNESVNVTSTVHADGTLDTGDIMVHISNSVAFVAEGKQMKVLD